MIFFLDSEIQNICELKFCFPDKMTEILIALPIEHSSIILADKLHSDSSFKVTFYVDPFIDNEFQSNAINDIQSVCPDPVKTIKNKVCKS